MTDQLSNKNNVWSGRFSEPLNDLVKKYTASVDFDKRLAINDLKVSQAYAEMLFNQKIIDLSDYKNIKFGLNKIHDEIISGKFIWLLDLEDVHLNIEKRLVEVTGESGKKLHTGKSRNDQVATDIRLYLRDEIDKILLLLKDLISNFLDLADQNLSVIMPGFTHLQVAQPITFSHHLMAYVEMFSRDYKRFKDCRGRVNLLPLGSAALAGTTFNIDRYQIAEALNFEGLCTNSIDAVSDRDFAIEFCSNSALSMMHISRLSEELVLWVNPSINFIEISDQFCTGSSIMPQKKNPDVPELARGKTGRVYGNLISLLTIMKAQPLAYNKDNQEDKEPIFDSANTLVHTLEIFTEIIKAIKVKPEFMRKVAFSGYSTATDLADYLVKKGLNFRDSHETVSKIVKFCENKNKNLVDLTIKDFQNFSNKIENDVFSILTLEGSVNSRNHIGGTSPLRVKKAIKQIRDEYDL
tara:strand:- start:124 stop:1521 length:1398 start_codon:yes stop_codon:yes gene_type:complete